MDCAVSQDYSNIIRDAQPIFTKTLSGYGKGRGVQESVCL